jgi:tetratricopeptide (TPR) repeat protein
MRRLFFMSAVLGLLFAAPLRSQQSSSSSVPDAPQPQAEKKAETKSKPANDAKPAAEKDEPKPAPKDENAFPEDVSKAAAAKAAQETHDEPAAGSGQRPTAADNPFPEAESKAAAKAAGNDSEPAAPAPDVPPGVSSSRSSSLDDVISVPGKIQEDPGRAKKDAEVGGYYLKSGNYQGALARFQDARTYDPANVDAIFGLAETQRMLKKSDEATRNYQLYLEILPDGPKSKQALKALKELRAGG